MLTVSVILIASADLTLGMSAQDHRKVYDMWKWSNYVEIPPRQLRKLGFYHAAWAEFIDVDLHSDERIDRKAIYSALFFIPKGSAIPKRIYDYSTRMLVATGSSGVETNDPTGSADASRTLRFYEQHAREIDAPLIATVLLKHYRNDILRVAESDGDLVARCLRPNGPSGVSLALQGCHLHISLRSIP